MAFKRNIFRHVNKFQARVLFYILALGVCALGMMVLFLAYLYADQNSLFYTIPSVTIKSAILIALPVTALAIVISCLYAFYLTNKILGPYERIIRELDEVLATNDRREVTVRCGDEMFSELLKRINALITRA